MALSKIGNRLTKRKAASMKAAAVGLWPKRPDIINGWLFICVARESG